MAQQAGNAAAAKLSELGLHKLNDYSSKGGRGGPHRGGSGGSSAQPGQKHVRKRTLERKLARSKGTLRQVDKGSGAMIGRAARLATARETGQARRAAEREGLPAPGKKKAPAPQQPAVKKAKLLPSTDPSEAVLPDFLRGSAPGSAGADMVDEKRPATLGPRRGDALLRAAAGRQEAQEESRGGCERGGEEGRRCSSEQVARWW